MNAVAGESGSIPTLRAELGAPHVSDCLDALRELPDQFVGLVS
jgi:hypothetical protein